MRPSSRGLRVLAATGWGALLALASWFHVVLPLRHLADTGGDFRGYHQAALALLEGRNPYLDGAFSYPPLLAIAVLPLATLSLDAARLVWYWASLLALGGAFVLTYRYLVARDQGVLLAMLGRPRPASGHVRPSRQPGREAPESGNASRSLAVVAVIWGLGGTVAENLVLGQVNPFLLLLLAAAGALVSRRPDAAAVAVGLAAALKVWPGALLVVFVLRRQWRSLALGAATAIVLIVVPGAIARGMVEGSMAVTEQSVPMGTAAPLNVSLPALALRLADLPREGVMPAAWIEGSAYRGWEPLNRRGWIAAAVALLVLAAAVLALRDPRPAGRGAQAEPCEVPFDPSIARPDPRGSEGRATALDLGVMTAAAILASPVSWYHYQLCQFFAMAVLLDRRLREGRWRAAVLLVAFTVAVTRAQPWLFGRYVERWGWTAEAPVALLATTSVGPVLGVVWLAIVVREARARGRLAAGA